MQDVMDEGASRCNRTPQLMSNWAHYTFLTVPTIKESETDECTQFDEYLVRMKAITITLYKIGGGVMIHRSVVGKRRWLTECAFSMKHDNQIV